VDCGEVSIRESKSNNSSSNVIEQFDRFANTYDRYNTVQKIVAEELVSSITIGDLGSVMDVGCGSGELYKTLLKKGLSFERFFGLDYSKNMLFKHPKDRKVELIRAEFDSIDFDRELKNLNLKTIISSSSLQWSKSLDFTLSTISKYSENFYLSIFTSNTFTDLHKFVDTPSPLHSKDSIKEGLKKYFKIQNLWIKKYKLHFESREDIFYYIKRSGVSGGERRLSFSQTKRLLREYPKNYLEFEVLFTTCNSKSSSRLSY
jgi:malonyl-CoA O-methyltransferase